MRREYDEAATHAALCGMSVFHRAAFAVACARRLLPHYDEFAKWNRNADPATMRHALTLLADAIREARPVPHAEMWIERCSELVPDEDEELPSGLVPLAENAAASVVYALRSYATGSVQDAVWAARQGYEATCYLADQELDADRDDPAYAARVDAHPCVQEELQAQARALTELST